MSATAVRAPPPERSFHTAETPYAIPNDDAEWERYAWETWKDNSSFIRARQVRLDAMHVALNSFFEGRKKEVPLGDPKSILDLGAGSGIWAAEMAQRFPEAEVVAVDISQIDMKRKPANCTFHLLNLTKEWPFAPESFDVIHCRFLLVHLPHWQEVMNRWITALKPGGLLLLEELDHCYKAYDGPPPEQATRLLDLYNRHMDPKGIDAHAGSKLEGFLRGTELFSQVNCVRIAVPMAEHSSDGAANRVGHAMKRSFTAAYSTLPDRLASSGITAEIFESWKQAISNPANKIRMDLFWTSACKEEAT